MMQQPDRQQSCLTKILTAVSLPSMSSWTESRIGLLIITLWSVYQNKYPLLTMGWCHHFFFLIVIDKPRGKFSSILAACVQLTVCPNGYFACLRAYSMKKLESPSRRFYFLYSWSCHRNNIYACATDIKSGRYKRWITNKNTFSTKLQNKLWTRALKYALDSVF